MLRVWFVGLFYWSLRYIWPTEFIGLLPLVGMVAAAGWRSRKPSRLIASLVLVAGALYVVVISILSMPARVDVPFAAATKGSAVEAEFKVATTMTYNFELNLYARKGDREDSDRVSKLVGTGAHRDGRQVDTGLAIPVRLRVERRDESGVSSILDNVFTDHDLQGHAADHFSKRITRIRLKPGRYRARIEAVDNVPQLEGIHVLFGIRVPGH